MNPDKLRAVVIGSGGSGTWLIEGLVRQLAFSRFKSKSALLIVDGDNYEPKNRARQNFKTLGNKAEVKAEEITPSFPEVFIAAKPAFVVDKYPNDYDPESETKVLAEDLLAEGDVVFCMVDNHATRKVVFDAARQFNNIDVYTGGNDEKFFGSTYHYVRRDGKDVTDHPGEYHPEFVNPPDKNPGLMSCQEKAELEGSTQLIVTNMTVAAILLTRFQINILDGIQDEHAEIFFDFSGAAGEIAINSLDRAAEVAELLTVSG